MIRQLLVDDKGMVLIAVFGVPPFSHHDDAVRGWTTLLCASLCSIAGLKSTSSLSHHQEGIIAIFTFLTYCTIARLMYLFLQVHVLLFL